MITLKPFVIDPTGWLEATWMDGDTPARCVSYHPTQIAMLRTDAAAMGTPLGEHQVVLDEWVSSYVPPAPPTPTPEQLQEAVVAATQQRLDDFAKTRNYDGILSACTYATSTVEKFFIEGQYAVQARDTTWAALYALLAEVQAGTRPAPASFEDVAPLLPALEWPQ